MKNKKLLVIVATTLMVCLVMGMGAMTYSKYITTTNQHDQATAANWGFVVTADATGLFGTDYNKTAGKDFATIVERNGNGVSVSAKADVNGDAKKIVAPGTTGSMTFSVEGTAEVKAQITITLTAGSEIKYNTYYPLVWTLKKGDTVVHTGTLAEIAEDFNTAGAVTINPGDDASTAGTYTLSWEWPLVTATAAGLNGTDRNVEDTLIGYKVNGKTWADIKDLYVGTYLIGKTDISTNYGAIVTSMDLTLAINIEQVQ